MLKLFKNSIKLSMALLAYGFIPAFGQNTVLTTSNALPGGGTGSLNVVLGPGNTYPAANNSNNNVFVGKDAGVAVTTGLRNSYIGYEAGLSTTTGADNSFLGQKAGYSNTTGGANTFLGVVAGYNNTAGNFNVLVGYRAGFYNTTGAYNSFMGYRTGYENTTGTNNCFVGYQAGHENTTAGYNTFLGQNAGYSNISGGLNSFIGSAAGYYNTTGQDNTFVGTDAGQSNTTASYNTFLGRSAGFGNTTGNYNSFTGYRTGFSNTTGWYNSFTGFEAAYNNTTGGSNSFLGFRAGYSNVTGSRNSFIGSNANSSGSNQANLQRATALGYNARVAVDDGLVLGDTTNVKVGIGTAYPNQRLTIRGNLNYVAYDNSMMLKNQPFLHFNERESLALGLGSEIAPGAEKTLVLGSKESTVQIPGILGTYQPHARQYLTINKQGKLILAQPRVQVASVGDWSDKVFEEDYALRPLSAVEAFVKKNKHLPGVPSAAEMVAEGMESAAFNAKLLEKIEELTLYVVALEKKNEEVKILREEVAELRSLIQRSKSQTPPK